MFDTRDATFGHFTEKLGKNLKIQPGTTFPSDFWREEKEKKSKSVENPRIGTKNNKKLGTFFLPFFWL